MDAYVQLALIEKSKLVFATDAGVFLSFPLLSPLTYTVSSLAALAAPQTAADYAAAADFARTVNFLPRDMVASPDGDRYLWDVYGDVLARAEVAGSSSAAVDQAAAAETLLYDSASDGTRTESAAYRAYRQYRDAWIVAREDYGAHKLTGEMTTDADAARHWLQVEEPALRTALASAENDWKTLGRRDDIDAALQAEHDAAVNDPRPRWQQWAAAFNPDVDLLSDAVGGGHYAPTGLSPKDFGSDGTWLHFDLSAGEMANLVANAPAELKVVLDGSTSTVDHVSFDYRSVAILRPWFNSSALTSRIWRSDDPQLNLSDGGDPPGGACPAYATAVVFIRNLEVTQRAADPAPAGPVDLRFTLAANRLTRRNLQFTPRIMLERAPSTDAPAAPIAINAQIAFRRLDRQSLAVAPESVARSAIAPMRFRPNINLQFNPGLINAVLANRLHVPIQVGPADPPQPQPTPTPTPAAAAAAAAAAARRHLDPRFHLQATTQDPRRDADPALGLTRKDFAMGDTDTAPDKTDTGWFTDGDQLTDFMADHRIADTTMRSSFEDAQAVIATFADSTETGAWASLDRATVAERLKGLLAPTTAADIGSGYRSIDQGALNLCGPAALLVMAIGRDPVAVAHYATDLFDTGSGSIGNFTVTASDDLRAADFADLETHGRIASQAEWMMLGAIRNTLQPFWQPDWNGDPDQLLAGMTRPEEIADWMRQTGIWSTVQDNGRWASNPGIPNATDLSVAEGTDTAMLIHANLLKESETVGAIDGPAAHNWSPLEYFPNHWVVLLSEITPSADGETLEFTVWTWASRVRLKTPKQVFLYNYFGTISASQ